MKGWIIHKCMAQILNVGIFILCFMTMFSKFIFAR